MRDRGGDTDALLKLQARISARNATVGVVGLGYVGLPLAEAVMSKGFRVLGFDIDPAKIDSLRQGKNYLSHFGDDRLHALQRGLFEPTIDFSRLAEADVITICVPTPLTRSHEPDLSFVVSTAHSIARTLRPGQLIVLESTTYPGTTSEILTPILEETGLQSGIDFLLAYSPEREDPGNKHFSTVEIPKIVGAEGELALRVAKSFYASVFNTVVTVSSAAAAEATKLTENIFRAVNIALVNELKVVFTKMGVDVWEVIDAAKTKPFGYMPFYPGPGLGGHCIPIDPFYLSWKARQHGIATRFIELAGEINTAMPSRVVDAIANALSERLNKQVSEAKVLLLGVSYKKNIDDVRESPTFRVMKLIESRGAEVSFFDPYVSTMPSTREHPEFAGRSSIELNEGSISAFDCAVVITDHDAVDYGLIERCVPVIIDTRNIFDRLGLLSEKIVKA